MMRRFFPFFAALLLLLFQFGCVEEVKKVTSKLPDMASKLSFSKDKKAKRPVKKVKSPSKSAKTSISSTYQVRLTPGWNKNGFRFLSLNGSRYSRKILLKQAKAEDSRFSLNKDGSLIIRLMNNFEIELAFYPPTSEGHEDFSPFFLDVYDSKMKIVSHQKIISRMKVYRAGQKKTK